MSGNTEENTAGKVKALGINEFIGALVAQATQPQRRALCAAVHSHPFTGFT